MKKSIGYNKSVLHYYTEGKGEPVVLIHGFGVDSSIWDKVVEQLRDRFLLIVPMLPGIGGTPDMKEPVSMESMAACIEAILVNESKNKAIVIGHSMGGYIALAFAEKYPQLLKAFGLFHSSAFADTEEKIEARRKSIAFIRQHGAAKFIEQSTPNLFSDDFKKKQPEIVRQLVTRYTNCSAESLVSYYEAMIERPDRTAVLKNIQEPVLFIMGEHDSAIPIKQVLPQTHLPAISHVYIFKKTSHMGMIEEEKKTISCLKKFLRPADI